MVTGRVRRADFKLNREGQSADENCEGRHYDRNIDKPSHQVMSTEAGLPPPEAPESPANPRKDIRDWHDIASLFVWGATLLAAVVAAFFTGRQAYLANKQLQVARDVLGVTQDTEKRQLRAYVVVDKVSVTLDGRTLKGIADVKNAGQTPAYDLNIKSRLETHELGQPFIPTPLDVAEVLRGILGPGSVSNALPELYLPSENTAILPALQTRLAVVYMIGQIQYRDAFDRKWVLDFRLRHHFDGSRLVMEFTEEGNKEAQQK